MFRGKSGIKIYLLTLLISVAVLGAVAYILLVGMVPIHKGAQTHTSSIEEYQFEPDAEQEITMLAVGCSNRGDVPYGFVLIKYSPAEHSLIIAPIPWQITATVGTKTYNLPRFYEKIGIQSVVSAVENAFDIQFGKYMMLDIEGFAKLVDYIGGVIIDLPNDISYHDDSGLTIGFNAGEQLLDGEMLASLFRYPNFEDGEISRCKFMGYAFAEMINQNLEPRLVPLVDMAFPTIINSAKSNINAADFSFRRDAIIYTIEKGGNIARYIEPQGEFDLRKTVFTPSDEYIAQVNRVFGKGKD